MLYAVAIIAAVLFLIKAADAIYNYYKCRKIENNCDENVEIGEANIRLVKYGDSANSTDCTAILLHGWGGAYPQAEFEPFCRKLSKSMNVILVERAGYGLNGEVYNPRNIETIMEETRFAVKELIKNGKVVLIAHSMGSLEAMYWAKEYPNDIKAVYYLDPCTPEYVKGIEIDGKSKVMIAANIIFDILGWSRIVSYVYPRFYKLGRVENENFEKAVAMIDLNNVSSAALSELSLMKRNSEIAAKREYPGNVASYAVVPENGLAEKYEEYLRSECKMKVEYMGKGHFIHCSSTDEVVDYILKTAI